MKILIELRDRGWYFEFYDKNGKLTQAGVRDTFFACCALCLELVDKEKNK